VVERLFSNLIPRLADRPGGYTRIMRKGPRPGDSAPMVIIEIVD
jgi:large subunit ribosomal protein L17